MTDDLLILRAAEVAELVEGHETEILEAVRRAYEAHARGESSLPHSTFLRFPDSARDRIIALPAYLGGDVGIAGMKWIASVPGNVERGLERASAVMVLNHRETGRPWAMLEGSIISKQRTAASAALGAKVLHEGTPAAIGFVGCGPINLEIARFLQATWPTVERLAVHDLSAERAERFVEQLRTLCPQAQVDVVDGLDTLLGGSEVVAFATSATQTYVEDLSPCAPGTTILHISLRDLAPELIHQHHNLVDDFDHVNRAATSIHLATEQFGTEAIECPGIGSVLLGREHLPERDPSKLRIYSPFGLGILDLAVASWVCEAARQGGQGTVIASFLP